MLKYASVQWHFSSNFNEYRDRYTEEKLHTLNMKFQPQLLKKKKKNATIIFLSK